MLKSTPPRAPVNPRKIKPSVAGAGLIALDVVLGEALNHDARIFAGGTCGNVLAILSHLGWRSHAIGYIGQDIPGARVLADLQDVGVNCDLLVGVSQTRTPVFLQQLRAAAGRPSHSFLLECPTCGEPLSNEEPLALPVEAFASSAPDVLFLDRLSSSALALARSARARGALVMYEPSARSDRRLWSAMLPLIDLLKYSGDRMRPEDFDEVGIVDATFWEIQTSGDRGLRYRRRLAHSPASAWVHLDAIPAARVVDTCGAGDWCTAGFLSELMGCQREMGPLDDQELVLSALRTGQALAAWACGFAGARGGMYEGEAGAIRARSHPDVPSHGICGRVECNPLRGTLYR